MQSDPKGSAIAPTFLENLTELKVLEIYHMWLTNLSSFSQLTHLEELSLYGIEVEETILHPAAGVRVVDFSPLRGLKRIKHLDLNGGPPCDLEFLSECQSLDSLALFSVMVVDLAPLSQLDQLTHLSLHQVGEIDSAVENLDSDQDAVGPQDLSFLAGMTSLEQLSLDSIEWEVAPPFGKLENVRWLEIFSDSLRDLTPMSKMKNLVSLTIDDTRGLEAEIKKLKQALPNCKVQKLALFE